MDRKYLHKKGTRCGCGIDISDRHKGTKQCFDCSTAMRRDRLARAYKEKKNAN